MTTTKTRAELPHWDMTPVFASLDSEGFEHAVEDGVAAVQALRERFDALGIRSRDDGTVDEAVAQTYDEVTTALNAVLEEFRVLFAYVYAFVTTDSRNDLAQAKLSELQREQVELRKLETRYEAFVGSLDADALVDHSDVAREHEHFVRRASVAASHQMSEAEEDLAASLQPSGSGAWTKLHGTLTSQIEVEVPGRGRLPMSAVRALAFEADAAVRKAGYDAELAAWEDEAPALAAALNSIKGATNTLTERRGWDDALAPVLFANATDRETLDAMQAACVDSFPDFRRYFRAKAKLLGDDRLAWWDLFAPVGAEESSWDWPDATRFVVQRFASYSERLAGLASRAFEEGWIDAEPRPGKRDGAFCMGIRGDVSRVLCNYTPSFKSVSTVAHELGHAYHNLCLADRTQLARRTPMALAETASILCQTIVTNAMLAEATGAERLAILEAELENASQIVVDIHSRFLFEQAVFTKRERRELSVAELCAQMREAQAAAYGAGVDADTYHPYMWAVKPHYYGSSFYNWPYTFGLLFGLGLYQRYTEDPDAFRSGYDELLSSTGMEDAATLASRFGIDVRDEGFWRSSLDVIRARIDDYEALATS